VKIRSKLIACFLLISLHLFAQPGDNTLLKQLDNNIDSTRFYDAGKYNRIGNIRQSFDQADDKGLTAQYNYYLHLYDEYKIFKFDTAFIYVKKLEATAVSLNDPFRIAQSKINLSFVLLSAGMFKEADEILNKIDIHDQPDSLKAAYYLLRGRYYYDLADYTSDDFFYPDYFKKAGTFLDSALVIFPSTSFEYIYYSGLKQMKMGDFERSFANFHTLLKSPGLTDHQLALTSSTLSYIYFTKNNLNEAVNYQCMAAIADIRSSTKETFAVLNLSQLLFRQGDFNKASQYIKKAVDDATSYGARQRKIQVSAILPIIQGSEINAINHQRKLWVIYAIIVSVIVILFAFLLVIIVRQNRKLEKARQEISSAHVTLREVNNRLEHLNAELHTVNNNLVDVNYKLEEANKIKDEYVGYFFTANAELFKKIEKFKTTIEEKIHYNKFNDVKFIINALDIKHEKEESLKSFDKAFLKLFPHFVQDFNALFNEEDKINLQDGELLNTDLRIYALLRLGIKENEKIAEILEYSVKSIYAYKTRIRNRAIIPRDEFDKKVIEIKSI
jgi:hypothetical protein